MRHQQWADWISANPNASAKDIYQQLGTMMDRYHINDLPINPSPIPTVKNMREIPPFKLVPEHLNDEAAALSHFNGQAVTSDVGIGSAVDRISFRHRRYRNVPAERK